MSETEHESKSLPLGCPYCGGKLLVEMEETGSGYMSYNAPSGFICTTLNCGAEWNLDGEPTHEPNWVLWPTIYTKPEEAKR